MKAMIFFLIPAVAVAADPLPSDRPVMIQVKSGTAISIDSSGEKEVLLPEGAFLNQLALEKVSTKFQGMQIELIESKAQGEALRNKVDEIAANPPLNIKTVLIVAGCALLAGTAAGVGIGLAIHK